jgi:hypothetical protein
MKHLKSVVVCLSFMASFSLAVNAQNYAKKLKGAKAVEVTYQSSYKGKVSPNGMKLTIVGERGVLSTVDLSDQLPKDDASKSSARPNSTPFAKTFLDYSENRSLRRAELPSGEVISTSTPFEIGKNLKVLREETYLGLPCTVYRTSVNSNTIDIWATTAVSYKGTPQPNVGVPEGLVLRVVRNGDTVQEATVLTPLKSAPSIWADNWGTELESYDYQYRINQSGVITVSVFDQQPIRFDGSSLSDNLSDNVCYSAGGGTIIMKKVKLPDNVADRDVFAELVQYSAGDAYDRTGSVFMIPTDKAQSFIDAMRDLNSVPSFKSGDTDYHGLVSTPKYQVPMELMRFFTGFGVRKFNHNRVPGQDWVDSVLYKTDITALSERLVGEVWVGAYIGNWDAEGHRVSLRLKYYPDEDRYVYHTIPLFNTVNYLEQAGQPYPLFLLDDTLTVKFTLTEAAPNARLYYLTTGHGGWSNGDEFNQKPNTISLDGNKVITFVPWREDCATYRNNNPCSGNYSNGLSSSDLSRSNWCPGTVTNPEYIYLGDLEAGEHTITVQIPQGAPEGGSNSYWCLSGTLIY